ncbi:MAG: 50S ribosomal protein L27 [Candidatus Paceibacterota bacterium]|jgi:large subunit ribosomal protein L27
MSKTKATGTSRLGRDARPKYLGVKLFAGEKAQKGSIIVRQRGSRIIAGKNVKMGKDNTLYAVKEGLVSFSTKRKKLFDGSQRVVKTVSVE